MVSAHPPISNTSSLLTKSSGTVTSAPSAIGITVTFVFFSSLARSKYLCLIIFFDFHSVVRQNGKVLYSAGHVLCLCHCLSLSLFSFFFFFLLIISKSGLLTGIRWSVCISISQRILCVSFSGMDSGFCIYHLVEWSC